MWWKNKSWFSVGKNAYLVLTVDLVSFTWDIVIDHPIDLLRNSLFNVVSSGLFSL